jgi:sporulation protein YlmC with PRC-barrel domain
MQRSNVWLATALLNERVRNSAGETLGKIEDIVLDPETGSIQYAVLSVIGAPGIANKLIVTPWQSLDVSPSRDYVVLNVDKERFRRAPAFDRDIWPDMADPVWRRSIDDYYYGGAAPSARERRVYVTRTAPAQREGMSLMAAIALICIVLALAWSTFLVSTRGWEQTKQDIRNSLHGAAYAAKETSQDAALTAKVRTALALSKRVPSGQINVQSEKNVVTLNGEVPSNEARETAESIAKDVPGVEGVLNHLFVTNRTQ